MQVLCLESQQIVLLAEFDWARLIQSIGLTDHEFASHLRHIGLPNRADLTAFANGVCNGKRRHATDRLASSQAINGRTRDDVTQFEGG
jgi:hypothetical protein